MMGNFKYIRINQLGLIMIFILLHCVQCSNDENTDSDNKRDRSHIDNVLRMDELQGLCDGRIAKTLDETIKIYRSDVKPLEDIYHFGDLHRNTIMTDGMITAKPLVLLVGPWSTGKTTMINYLLGINETKHKLLTGAEPTTSDFTVLMHGSHYKTVEGLVLATDSHRQFSSLEKFGQGFLEKFQGIEMPYKLLEKVNLVDTPGIIENRKQQERGYPYNDVMRWFMDRADLILIVFDPSKLDVGAELESLFKELKGHESQIRIILNKADSLSAQELMRVYGALFWNLAPLINVTEPPRVYVGSFWHEQFRPNTIHELFRQEEISLLMDLQQAINNLVENKIAMVRQHAYLVRLHALVVDQYINAYLRKNSLFADSEQVLSHIVNHPENYNIYNSLLSKPFVSKYDLPSSSIYKEFFSINALNVFKPLNSHCSMFNGCIIDHITHCIASHLPQLLNSYGQCDYDQI